MIANRSAEAADAARPAVPQLRLEQIRDRNHKQKSRPYLIDFQYRTKRLI
jgi:hypothetical protein